MKQSWRPESGSPIEGRCARGRVALKLYSQMHPQASNNPPSGSCGWHRHALCCSRKDEVRQINEPGNWLPEGMRIPDRNLKGVRK
jgi:hypothetical protein